MNTSLAARMTAAFVAVIAMSAMAWGLLLPDNNWDIVGYVAAAHEQDGLAGKRLATATYGDLRAAMSANDFRSLTGGVGQDGAYRRGVFSDQVALAQNVPFYSVKPAFVGLMRAIDSVGIPYPEATHLISAAFSFAAVVILYLLLRQSDISPMWLPLIAVAAGVFDASALSSPDAMACAFSLAAFYLLIEDSEWLFACTALLPVVRPDLVVLSGLLLAVQFFKGHALSATLSGVGAVACYIAVSAAAHSGGYARLFDFTFFNLTPYPATVAGPASAWDYAGPYIRMPRAVIIHPRALIYLLCAPLLFFAPAWSTWGKRHTAAMIAIAYVGLHLLSFPEYADRFFVASAAIVLLFLTVEARTFGKIHQFRWRT